MVHSIADITPNSTATPLASTRTPANWLQIICPATNAGDIRIGDSLVSASRGLAVAKGSGQAFPPISDDNYLDLSMIYVYGTGSDKVTILYGVH